MGLAITGRNLAREFAGRSATARQAVAALCDAIRRPGEADAAVGARRWAGSSIDGCSRDPDALRAALGALAGRLGLAPRGASPVEVLLALGTYYALVVKLLASHVVAPLRGQQSLAATIAASASGPAILKTVESFEGGQSCFGVLASDLLEDDPFSWYAGVGSQAVLDLLDGLARRIAAYDPRSLGEPDCGADDPLADLYQALIPRRLRHQLGEYYTPGWLAEHVLDQVGYSGDPEKRLLDPSCGSGTFLALAIRRVRLRHGGPVRPASPDALYTEVARNIVGFDLNPLAVLAARANYLMALGDWLPRRGPLRPPVLLRDSILGRLDGQDAPSEPFDFVVGNPPWIAWDNLPADYRKATRPLWQRYGLFSLGASEGRHGGGKKDLAMLMLYAAADRYLRRGGRLGMVITQTVFQTGRAGDGFRRFRLGPEGDWLGVLRVDDLTAMRPFEEAANWTSTIVLAKGEPTRYPVPYVRWLPAPGQRGRSRNAGHAAPQTVRHKRFVAFPSDPARPGSPWLLRPREAQLDSRRLAGPSDYAAHLGANTGGANGVYWLEVVGPAQGGVRVRNLPGRGKHCVEPAEAVLEPELLYPLVRWKDVDRYRAKPSAWILLVQDFAARTGIAEETLRRDRPRAYAYLKRYEPLLRRRAAYRAYQGSGPFYSMYNVGPYTAAPVKVVWRRMDRLVRVAVVEPVSHPLVGSRPVVPQETCAMIGCKSPDEAHYLCALMNSRLVGMLATLSAVRGGKGFGSPGMLDVLGLKRFDPADPRHQQLAECSLAAHRQAAARPDRSNSPARKGEASGSPWQPDVQGQIDALAAEISGLSRSEAAALGELA